MLCVWGLAYFPDSDLLVQVRQREGGRPVSSSPEECTEVGWECRPGGAKDTDRPFLRMTVKFVPYERIPD